jgi:hypothetical protein
MLYEKESISTEYQIEMQRGVGVSGNVVGLLNGQTTKGYSIA